MTPSSPGLLVVNADDWGHDRRTTQMIHDTVRRGAVSSVSAMVFMQDSDHAAAIACEEGLDTGLHLNFTTPFSGKPSRPLAAHQEALTRHLRRHWFAKAVYHPGLTQSFEYVVTSQLEEYQRLYGHSPQSLDGHHHMHLCANVLVQKLLPAGTLVRRHFAFQPGEKSLWNRRYRAFVDRRLQRRCDTVDLLFALAPLAPERLSRIMTLAREVIVEVETHPADASEYHFLMNNHSFLDSAATLLAPRSAVRNHRQLVSRSRLRAASHG